MPSSVLARRLEGILLLELRGPDDYPRLERAVLASLHLQLDAAAAPDACGVVITGTDRAFAVGANLEEVSQLTPLEALRFSTLGQDLMQKTARFPKPVVAAVRGYCFGGGFDLALACSERVATPDAIFAHASAGLGIITGWGGTARLPRLAGRACAAELFAAGSKLTAEEAYARGLILRIVPPDQLISAAVGLARRPAQPETASVLKNSG